MSTEETVRRFRQISLTEGISYLVLLGVAMPLKYLADQPAAVRVVGMLHGVLFILFCLGLVGMKRKTPMDTGEGLICFIWSLVPFGFIFIDRRARRY